MKVYTNIDLRGNEAQNVVIQQLASAPSNPKRGQIYDNTSDGNTYMFDGTNWVLWVKDANYVHTDTNFTQAEKTKLSGIEDGAQVNTVTGVKGAAETEYRIGNVSLDKDDIGLNQVDNTADIDKPISTATQDALDDKVDKIEGKGLSENDFTDHYKTIVDGIAERVVTGVKGDAESDYRGGNVNLTKANIGLGNVDNTSDANKPVSTATQTVINNEIQARTLADNALQGNIDAEASARATAVSNEALARGNADTALGNRIAVFEASGAHDVAALEGALADEIERATDRENAIEDAIPTKLTQLTNDGNFVQDANYIHTDNNYTTNEKTKLGGIEAGAQKNLANTVVDANYVHTDNNYTTAEKTKLAGLENYDDTSVKADISDIKALIPSEATAQNQLADKAFTNSSIATNTANYISNHGEPFTSPADLPTTGVTNNDYAFVTGSDDKGNAYYDRYKATVTGSTVSWAKEYRLNNSSFTAAQWAAINSGASTEVINSIAGKYVKPAAGIPKTDLASGVQTSLGKADTALQEHQSLAAYRTSANQDIIDNGLSNRISDIEDKEATWDGKQDAISDLGTIRSNAAAGAGAATTIAGYGDVVTHDTSDFATSTQGSKADTAVQPAAIADMETKTHASQTYQPKGSYLTSETDPVFTASAAHGISSTDITNWNNKGTYSKPSGGIPKNDLASTVQQSLNKADSALQEHQSLDAYRTSANQDTIDNGIKDRVTTLENTTVRYEEIGTQEEVLYPADAIGTHYADSQEDFNKSILYALQDKDYLKYGVRIDFTQSSPALTRIGNMNLHRTLPIQNKMRRCIVNDLGQVVYYLDANDSTKKENGDVANLTGADGQYMVEIPAHYRGLTIESEKVWKVEISEFDFRGAIYVPKMYVGAVEATVDRENGNKLASVCNTTARYRGCGNQSAWDGTYRSALGLPATAISLTNYRNYAKLRGSIWGCYDYQAHLALYWLFTIEYATRNCQLAYNSVLDANDYHQGGLGAGVTNINSTRWSNYNGYYPIVPCGWTNSLGNKTGIVTYAFTEDQATHCGEATDPYYWTTDVPSYRGVENPFGHIWKWTDGALFDIKTDADGGTSKAYICRDYTKYGSTITSDYKYLCDIPRAEGYVKEIAGDEFADMITTTIGGGSTTYGCDYYYTSITSSSTRGLLLGGTASNGSYAGFGYVYTYYAPSSAPASVGSRLCCHV